MSLAVDLLNHLVEVPSPAAGLHAVDPALADFGGEHPSEAVPPKTDGPKADMDVALVQQVLNIPQ